MADSAMTVVAIFLAAILMFIFPLMTMADNTDEVSTLAIETATTEFTDNARTTGKITLDSYDSFLNTLAATGNAYDVEITVQVLDENPSKKATSTDSTTIGDNVYYTVYTTQIVEELYDDDSNNTYLLKEGDIISVSVENTNTTVAMQLRNFLYKVTGSDTSTIEASASGIVTVTGS